MNIRSTSVVLVLIAALCAPQIPGQTQAKPAVNATGLTVVAVDGVQRVSDSVARFDFGSVDSLSSAALTHTFVLRNRGATRLVIERVQPSRGCTTALLQTKTGNNATADLAPGEKVSLRATVSLDEIRPGKLSKYIYIFTLGNSTPAATIEMKGSLQEIISFTPQSLDFGAVSAGSAHTIAVTARINKRLLDGKHTIDLASSAPDVAITPLPAGAADAASDREVRNYSITIPADARLGEIRGSLFFKRQAAGAAPTSSEPRMPLRPIYEDALGGAYATITATVVGKITALPRTIVFGSFYAGKAETRQLDVVARTMAALQDLKAAPGVPWVETRWSAPKEAAPAVAGGKRTYRRTLTVVVSAGAPEGGHEIEVSVKTPDGERLVIPVFINVIATPPTAPRP